jgi:hypothetical protein
MKKLSFLLLVTTAVLTFYSCSTTPEAFRRISPETLKDKIAGGWAGKMVGVTFGAPTEFHAQGTMYDGPLAWKPADVRGSIWQDDIYVQLTFLMAMDKYGMNAPAKKYQEMFAKAGYPLWHANMQARKNYYDSIFVPASGSPEFNIHADDIDFQIEADYIGFMCPGMPQVIADLAGRIGHIMNYGDGVYGGIFVSALYSEAFFEPDIPKIITRALKSIPEKSEYHRIIEDVILLYQHYPSDWQAAWKELQDKWGDEDICGAGSPFNIDAKLNGAYIVMGLLYGGGDPSKTLEITTRCGQDSDCNPSNAMAVLGVIKGFHNLPASMQEGVRSIADSIFINTTYSFNTAVASTFRYAGDIISKNGGKISEKEILIKTEEPVASDLEVSFPDVVFSNRVSVFDKNFWKMTPGWKETPSETTKSESQAIFAGKTGEEMSLKFAGTGISIEGNWVKDGGKADVFVDGNLNRAIDTYYHFAGQEHNTSIWHVFNLTPGDHLVRLVVKGEKRQESEGTNVYVTSAIIFKTAPKKSVNYKFSFEK